MTPIPEPALHRLGALVHQREADDPVFAEMIRTATGELGRLAFEVAASNDAVIVTLLAALDGARVDLAQIDGARIGLHPDGAGGVDYLPPAA